MAILSKPTVILATHNFFPHQWGGTEIYVYNFAKELLKKGIRVVIYTSFSSSKPKTVYFEDENLYVLKYNYDSLDIFGVRYKSVSTKQIYSKFSVKNLDSWKTLLRMTNHTSVEVLHLNCFTPTIGLDLLRAFKELNPKIKIIKSYHTVISDPKETMTFANTLKEKPLKVNLVADFLSYKLNIPYTISKVLCFFLPKNISTKLPYVLAAKSLIHLHSAAFTELIRLVDEWHIFSKGVENILTANGVNQEKITYERHGIANLFLEHGSSSLNKESEIFLYNGRLNKIKGVVTLLKAWLQTPVIPNRKLWICSDRETSDKDINKYIEEINLRDDVRWLGQQSQENLLHIYLKSKYVIIPSECYETGPLVFHEAIACGCLVIASDIGGNSELGKHYAGQAYNFEAGNAKELANIIKNGLKTRAIVHKPTSFSIHFKQIIFKSKIYQTVID